MRHGVVISFRILEKWQSTSLRQLPVLINNVFPTMMTPSTLQEQQKKHQSITDIGRIDYGIERLFDRRAKSRIENIDYAIYSFGDMYQKYEFLDGTPFGIKEE